MSRLEYEVRIRRASGGDVSADRMSDEFVATTHALSLSLRFPDACVYVRKIINVPYYRGTVKVIHYKEQHKNLRAFYLGHPTKLEWWLTPAEKGTQVRA